MARYHIRYAAYDETVTLFSPPSAPRQSTANRDANDVQFIDLTDDSPEDAAPATHSANNAMMPPPSTTLRRKRLSTGDSTPTSTKRARPLESKLQADVQLQMTHGYPSAQSPGYQPLSGVNGATLTSQVSGSPQLSTPMGSPYAHQPMAQGFTMLKQTASTTGINGAVAMNQPNGSPQMAVPTGSTVHTATYASKRTDDEPPVSSIAW